MAGVAEKAMPQTGHAALLGKSPQVTSPSKASPPGSPINIVRAYASKFGWAVFPVRRILGRPGEFWCDCEKRGCEDVGKHPRALWGEEATVEISRLEYWWGAEYGFPTDGVGIATGALSNLFVLDIDPKNGGYASLTDLEARHGPLPLTPTVITGSGGEHRYFKYAGAQCRNTREAIASGVDTRGDGGYVVAPPSLHRSGNRYRWKINPNAAPLAEPPEWLLAAMGDASPRKASGSRAAPVRRRRKQGEHSAPVPWNVAAEHLDEMLQHPLIHWMREFPDDVDRETWRGVAQNLACAVLDYEDLLERARAEFHALSEDYHGYSVAETDRTFTDAIKSVAAMGPMTFAHMASSGMPEDHWSAGATALADAARRSMNARRCR